MLDPNLIAEEIQRQGFIEIPFPRSKSEIDATMDTFVDFLSLPLEYKQRFFFYKDPSRIGSETGYVRNWKGEGASNNQEYFHYRMNMERDLEKELAGADPKVLAFFKVAKELYDVSLEAFQEVIRSLATKYPGIYETFFPEGKEPYFTTLRFLKYDFAHVGDFLAKAHYDRSAGTLAIAESAPGLQMGRRGEQVTHPVSHKPGTAMFFPGLHLAPLTSAEEFPPTWHEVIQKEEAVFDREKGIARWALVFFVCYEGIENVSKVVTHSRVM